MSIGAAVGTENNSNGNGQFSSLRRSVQETQQQGGKTALDLNDPRMRFRNSADPLYVAYEYIDNQPLSTLAASFVKESVFEIMNFVSKVVKG